MASSCRIGSSIDPAVALAKNSAVRLPGSMVDWTQTQPMCSQDLVLEPARQARRGIGFRPGAGTLAGSGACRSAVPDSGRASFVGDRPDGRQALVGRGDIPGREIRII